MTESTTTGFEVAVIGMAGRFPGASSVEELWRRLEKGEECITHFTPEELEAAGVDPELLADPAYVRSAGVIDGIELFGLEKLLGVTAVQPLLHEQSEEVWIEMVLINHAHHDLHHHRQGFGWFVGAIGGGERFEHIGDGHHAGLGGHLFAAEPHRVSTAVHPFVMSSGDCGH